LEKAAEQRLKLLVTHFEILRANVEDQSLADEIVGASLADGPRLHQAIWGRRQATPLQYEQAPFSD
jgi:hypothetical protein